MPATIIAPIDLILSGSSTQGVVPRITAAIAAAMARAKARHEYRRLLECDEVMLDVGVGRDDVRKALLQIGG